MIPAPAIERPLCEPCAAPDVRRRLRVSIVATLLLFTAAAGLRTIAAANPELPPIDVLLRDARDVFLPWLRGDATVGSTLFQAHDAGARLLSITWVSLNGQVDARILALSGLALGLLALTVLLHVLSGQLRPAARAILAAATATLLMSPAFSLLDPLAGTDGSAGMVLLSLLHLALVSPARARTSHFVAGLACGLLNLLYSSAGFASALALALWSAVEARRDAESPRVRFRRPAVHALLAICGAVLVALRADATGLASWTLAAAKPITWPFSHVGWSIVVWAPAAVCLVRWAQRRTAASCPGAQLGLLALWAGLLALASAATGLAGAPAVFATGIIVNAACLCALAGGAIASDSRRFAALALWIVLLANALLQPPSSRDHAGLVPVSEGPLEPALQLALRQDDTSGLAARPGWTRERIDTALTLLRDPLITRILPASIRPPLKVEWESPRPADPFASATQVAIPGSDALPTFGTWTADNAVSTTEYISRPLRTSFPILQFRLAGELRPPATSLTLHDEHARVADAWSGPFNSPTRWRRVNFAAPAEVFRIAVHDRDAASWIAFTAPVELGRISWLAGKTPGLWPWLLAGGFIVFLPAARAAFRARKAALASFALPPVSAGSMQLLPWLALAAGAIFLSSHLDTTAGPNDSGGYLNAAKILAGGRITAAPHAPLSVVTNASEVAPYVPETFRPTADGRMAPNYPIGFPLLVAALAQVMPFESAVGACLWLHLIAGVVLVQRFARVAGLTDGWAWLAAGIVGLSPVYLFHGLQPMSDVPALVWATAAIHLAWAGGTDPRRAFLAGVATAVAVFIRPSNVFCALPIILCLAGRWRSLALWIGGGLPGAVGLAWLNYELYGGIFASGYGDIRTMLGHEFLIPTLRSYAQWLPVLFTPVVCLAPATLFLRTIPGRTRLILLVWAAVFLNFYAFYWCTWDHWCGMRFVLPAAPALVILGLLALQHLLPRLRLRLFEGSGGRRQLAASAIIVVLLLGSLVADSSNKRLFFWLDANREHAVVANWVRAHAPADAIVLAHHATGSVVYYTKLTCIRVDFAPGGTIPADLLGQIRRSGRPVFAVIHPSEAPGPGASGPPAGAWGLSGDWHKVASPWHGGASVWQRQPSPRSPVGPGAMR